MKYKLIIAYDGTRYSGWQFQPNAPTIQAHIQDALKLILKESITIHGSGRTDAGVHAHAQVAHFNAPTPHDPERLRTALNGILPYDIRIIAVDPVSDPFHAQFSAIGKTYHYHLYLNKVDDPFTRPYHLKLSQPIDLELLELATKQFIGTHDFTSFANEPGAGAVAKNPIRTIKRIDIVHEPGGVRLEFESKGFLYKMVRNIMGTLLEVVSYKRSLAEIPEIFAAKDRRKAGMAAPAHGLFLAKVDYPAELLEIGNESHRMAYQDIEFE